MCQGSAEGLLVVICRYAYRSCRKVWLEICIFVTVCEAPVVVKLESAEKKRPQFGLLIQYTFLSLPQL